MFASIKSYYLELPIWIKFQLWFLPFLILSAGSIGFISYTTASNQVLDKTAGAQENILSQTITHLDYLANDIYDIYNYLSLSTELHDLLSADANYNSAQIVNKTINRLLSTRQFFQSLLIFSDGHPAIQYNSLNNNEIIGFDEYKKYPVYARSTARVSKGAWGVEDGSLRLFIGDQRRKVFYSKVLVNPENFQNEGLMIIGLTEQDFRKSFAASKDNVEIIIVNDDGTIFSDSAGKWSGRPFTDLPYYNHAAFRDVNWSKQDPQWLISHSSSSLTGWHVLVIQPKTEELGQLYQIRWITIVIVLIIMLVNVPISWAVSQLLSKPLKQILKSMRELQAGNFNQYVEVKLRDEIGQLGKGYNIMVTRIRDLIQDVYETKLSRNEAELRLLQSQINPHFLYNTLNSIAWMAYMEKADKTADMIQKLSGFFRYSLSQGADVIPVAAEIAIVENYLYLCKIRFGEKLSYSIEVDEGLKTVMIPKLLIQPLVENAVVHGIERMEGEGFVHVSAHESDGGWTVEVTDNGTGIAPDTLDKLRAELRADKRPGAADESDGFALLNIRDRLRHHFDDTMRIDIVSRPNMGTTIRIHMGLMSAREEGIIRRV